jgi:hypothetical protein
MSPDGIKLGSLNDPVAQNIRNQQRGDGAPTKSEQKAQRSRRRTAHAEYKAATAFLNQFDVQKTKFTFRVVTELFGFDSLSKILKESTLKLHEITSTFVEPHGFPDETHPQSTFTKAVVVDHDLREMKQERFLVVQDALEQIEDFRRESKIMNPFGASRAQVVVVDHDTELETSVGACSGTHQRVFTNETFEKVMDDSAWSDRFDQETIAEFQQDAQEIYHTAVGWI